MKCLELRRGKSKSICIVTFLLLVVLFCALVYTCCNIYRDLRLNQSTYHNQNTCETCANELSTNGTGQAEESIPGCEGCCSKKDNNFCDRVNEAIVQVLTVMGAVNIALGYINAVRTRTVAGFSTHIILSARYPYRICFFVGQALFVLLGIYCAVTRNLIPAVVSLLGALVCLVYSIVLALRVVYSNNAIYCSTRKYIESCVKYDEKCPQTRQYNDRLLELIRHCARHLNQRFLNHELSPEENNREIDFDFLAMLLSKLRTNPGDSSIRKGDSSAEVFNRLFGDGKSTHIDWQKAVYYEIPAVKQNVELFIQCVNGCHEMWATLLAGVQHEQQKTGLAQRLLQSTAKQGVQPAMLCGLIVYMHQPGQVSGKTVLPNNVSYASFLRMIAHAMPYPPTPKADTEIGWACNKLCGEVAVIALCLFYLENYYYNKDYVESIYYNCDQFLAETISLYEQFFVQGSQSLRYYMTYAWLVFRNMNNLEVKSIKQIVLKATFQEAMEELIHRLILS